MPKSLINAKTVKELHKTLDAETVLEVLLRLHYADLLLTQGGQREAERLIGVNSNYALDSKRQIIYDPNL